MGLPKPQLYTVDEYLALERAAEDRHIYLDGAIFAMAGESLVHKSVWLNFVSLLRKQLKRETCRVFAKDIKVRSGPEPMSGKSTRGMFSYPDAGVFCGEPEFHDAFQDILLNPKVLVEVLSPLTRKFDKGDKFTRFKTWNPTLTDYVLAEQDHVELTHHWRLADGTWDHAVYTKLAEEFTLRSVRCKVRLKDVYAGIDLGKK